MASAQDERLSDTSRTLCWDIGRKQVSLTFRTRCMTWRKEGLPLRSACKATAPMKAPIRPASAMSGKETTQHDQESHAPSQESHAWEEAGILLPGGLRGLIFQLPTPPTKDLSRRIPFSCISPTRNRCIHSAG